MKIYKLWGVKLNAEDFDTLLRFGKLNPRVVEFLEGLPYKYEEKDRVEFIKLLIKKTPLLPSKLIFVSKDEDHWLGRDFSNIGMEETGKVFRENIQELLLNMLGSGSNCGMHSIVVGD